MKDNVWIDTVSFIVIALSFATLQMKQNVNPVKVISEKDKIRIVNILFKVNYFKPTLITLPCDFIKTGLYHGYFPRNVPIPLQDSHFIKQV